MITGAGLAVIASDVGASRIFYQAVLGMEIEDEEDGSFVARWGEFELRIEGGGRARKRGRRWMEEAGVYVTCTTDDFDELVAGLTARGGRLLGDVVVDSEGRRYCGVADPDGLLIEFVEA
jgi:catechol 2,3-dioxygenase-like lactoylglutathione lyase family enzyme